MPTALPEEELLEDSTTGAYLRPLVQLNSKTIVIELERMSTSHCIGAAKLLTSEESRGTPRMLAAGNQPKNGSPLELCLRVSVRGPSLSKDDLANYQMTFNENLPLSNGTDLN